MANQNINSSETIYVLNEKYQYEVDNVSTNAKWLDTNNVLSVNRDKTIYAVRATNTYDFTSNTNQEFFASAGSTGTSDLYQNFGSTTQQSILMTNPAPVYGSVNAGQVGLAGSLLNGFGDYTPGVDGAINVSSEVSVDSVPSTPSQLPTNIVMNTDGSKKINVAGSGNVIGSTCGRVLQLTSNINTPVWNRLINGQLNGRSFVNCSTDPCDLNGAAIPYTPSSNAGNAVSNEAYREQVAVKSNPTATNLSINNPVYIASVSPFGTNLTGTVGVAENVSLHSFTGNFFANLPADNVIYANGGSVLTGVSISGTINDPILSLFNSNVLVASSLLNGVNLSNAPSTLNALNNVVSVTINTAGNNLDTLSNSGEIIYGNGDLNATTGTFKTGDQVMVVQGNVEITPSYLMDRLSTTTSAGFVLASNIFSYGPTDTRSSSVVSNINNDVSYFSIAANLQSGTNFVESSAKYLYLTGISIKSENWELIANNVQPVSVPQPSGIPNQSNYTTGNVVDVYVQKGSVGVSNYTPYENKTNTGSWVTSIPSFMNTFSEPTGNAYLDTAVFGNVGTATKDINIGTDATPVPISATLVDNYNFYFFGNTSADSRVDKRVGNVVANTSSVMADIWSYNNTGVANSSSTTQWSPMIVYGDVVPSNSAYVVRPLSLTNDFAKENVDYKLEFKSYVGKTKFSAPTNSNYSFFANISNDGLAGNATATNLNQFNLNNNRAVNDILLNDVVSTTFTVKSNSYKYTDIGTIVSQNSNNSEFNAVLPFAGNVSSADSSVGYPIQDVAMNVIVDYFQNPVLLSGDVDNVHRLTIYDVQYRYAITNVSRSGASPLNTKLTINGLSDLATNLMNTNGNISASTLNVNVAAPEFTLFTYDNVGQYSSSDALYPFTDFSSTDKDRRFPGFNYRQDQVYSSKTDTEVDFTIDANTLVEQNVSFLFQAINTNGKTVSVAKSTDNAFKSIPIRTIKFGSSGGVHPYYGYIVIKVLGEASSYVVILYKLDANGINYDANIGSALPVIVNVKSIELSAVGSKQQVEFKSALRVYSPSGALIQSFTNTVNSHKSPLSLFNYSTMYGSNDSSVGVNTYAAPPSNAIMQWAYTQSVVQQLIEYSYVNNVLDGMSGYKAVPSQTSGTILFARTELNTTTSAKFDPNDVYLAKIPALSRRCYLDAGFGNGVYIDILNTYVLSQSIVFSVDRSVEWQLTRKLKKDSVYELVGRGLMSLARNETSSYETRDYLILENDTTKATSGFQMTVSTNVVDLSARLLAQSISTGTLKNGTSNELALNISTVADNLAMVIYKVNPVSGVEDLNAFAGPYSCSASSTSIDLAELKTGNSAHKGQLPSFNLTTIRGYQLGEINNRTNALFSVNYTRDNYAIIQLFQNANKTITTGGRLENGTNVTFSGLNTTQFQLYCSSLGMAFNNVAGKGTLNKDFAPLTNTSKFVKYASFKHMGFGSMSYSISNFTSNYGKSLPAQDITSGSDTPAFAFSSNDAYKVSTPVPITITENVVYDTDPAVNKYYVPIISLNQTTRLYFRGTGLNSLPTQFSEKNTVLLYTGTRPMVISTITMANNTTLANLRDNVANVSSGMFNNKTWLKYNSPHITKQTYAVFFTNVIQTGVAGSITTRSLKISPLPTYFTNAGKFYLGSFINSSGLLSNNFVNVSYTNGTYKYPFTIIGSQDIVNPVQSSDVITSASGAVTTLCDTFTCKNTQLGNLFSLTLTKSLAAQNYNVNINPSTVKIYEAIDWNRDGELDIWAADNTNFGLDAAFSELLYTPTPVSGTAKLNVPKVVDSWALDREYHNIKGSSLDMNMNVKWNVGYNLGNFFTIRQNNVANFDVIAIHTEFNSSANSNNMTSLVASLVSELTISGKNSWAHAPLVSNSQGPLTGLTFKVNGNKIVTNDTIRLFVDNKVSDNNTLSFSVGNKTYKLSSYDQERYAALLDEQIRYTNKIE
jgi:hypothetical protein